MFAAVRRQSHGSQTMDGRWRPCATRNKKDDFAMRKHVKANVSWVGYIDWELQHFHGDEYSIINGPARTPIWLKKRKPYSLIRFGRRTDLSLLKISNQKLTLQSWIAWWPTTVRWTIPAP
jgi:hypothetical protein